MFQSGQMILNKFAFVRRLASFPLDQLGASVQIDEYLDFVRRLHSMLL